MSKEIIAKLNDEELEAVCGGGAKDELEKGFFGEAGKFCFAVVGAPIIGALTTLAVWGMNRLIKKLDTKLDGREAINAAIAKANATVSTNA